MLQEKINDEWKNIIGLQQRIDSYSIRLAKLKDCVGYRSNNVTQGVHIMAHRTSISNLDR